MITVSTKIMARGADIDPKHERGLYVIQTYLDTPRETRQIIGRCARNGRVGKYRAVYEINGLPFYHSLTTDECKNEKMIEQIQNKMNEEASVQRYFIQEVDGLQQVLMKQVKEWGRLLRGMYPAHELPRLNKELLLIQESIISQINEQWKNKLDDSDPDKKYPNPYLRRDKSGKLDTKDILKALTEFETTQVPEIWNKALSKLTTIKMKLEMRAS